MFPCLLLAPGNSNVVVLAAVGTGATAGGLTAATTGRSVGCCWLVSGKSSVVGFGRRFGVSVIGNIFVMSAVGSWSTTGGLSVSPSSSSKSTVVISSGGSNAVVFTAGVGVAADPFRILLSDSVTFEVPLNR